MALLPEQARQTVDALAEQGRSALAGAKGMARHTLGHAAQLVQLFGIELQEYRDHRMRQVIAMVAGCIICLFAYGLLCMFLCLALAEWVGLLWGVGIVFLLNLLAGILLLSVGMGGKPEPLAPATRQELKNDWQCIKLLLSDENKKS